MLSGHVGRILMENETLQVNQTRIHDTHHEDMKVYVDVMEQADTWR